jgi:hypothetical protein
MKVAYFVYDPFDATRTLLSKRILTHSFALVRPIANPTCRERRLTGGQSGEFCRPREEAGTPA